MSAMNCDEVIRELAVPTDDRDSVALAEHVSRCRTCAHWAQRAEEFDRVWNVTRPQEPSPETWEALWLRVTAALGTSAGRDVSRPLAVDQGNRPMRLRPSPRRRRWQTVAIGLIALSQAAAVLLAVALTRPIGTKSLPSQVVADAIATPLPVNLEIAEGHLVVIRWEHQRTRMDDRTPHGSFGFDDWLTVFNMVEGLSKTAVAMNGESP
jgi:hypothetical protein